MQRAVYRFKKDNDGNGKMSERLETVMDILAEMRSNGFDDPRFDKYALWAARRLAKDWADRIEAAMKRGA